MRRARSPLVLLAVLSTLVLPCVASGEDEAHRPPPRRADAVRVLLVTGGHDHDVSFYSVLDRHEDLEVRVDGYPSALRDGPRLPGEGTDVVVLYDMPVARAPAAEETLRQWVEGGGGVVSLHHAIAGRTGWRWWYEEVVGGRYVEKGAGHPASSFRHDEVVRVEVAAAHPVTAGIEPFVIHDETYKDLWISPRVRVLLRTNNPTSDGPVAWISPYPAARVVYVQLGHGREAHLHPSFRRLVHNAVFWAAGRPTVP